MAGGGEEPGRERRGGVMIRQGSSLCDFCSFSVFCVVLGFLVQGTQQAGSEITEFGGSIRRRTLVEGRGAATSRSVDKYRYPLKYSYSSFSVEKR